MAIVHLISLKEKSLLKTYSSNTMLNDSLSDNSNNNSKVLVRS